MAPKTLCELALPTVPSFYTHNPYGNDRIVHNTYRIFSWIEIDAMPLPRDQITVADATVASDMMPIFLGRLWRKMSTDRLRKLIKYQLGANVVYCVDRHNDQRCATIYVNLSEADAQTTAEAISHRLCAVEDGVMITAAKMLEDNKPSTAELKKKPLAVSFHSC